MAVIIILEKARSCLQALSNSAIKQPLQMYSSSEILAQETHCQSLVYWSLWHAEGLTHHTLEIESSGSLSSLPSEIL